MTTSEAEVVRWLGREHDLHRAVDELHEAGQVVREARKQDSKVVHAVWIY